MNAKKKEKALKDYANVPAEELELKLIESKDFSETEIAEIVKAFNEPKIEKVKVKQHQIKKDYVVTGIALTDWEQYEAEYEKYPAYKMVQHVKVHVKPVFKMVRDEDENVYRAMVGIQFEKSAPIGETLIAPETARVLNQQIVNAGAYGCHYYLAKDLIEL